MPENDPLQFRTLYDSPMIVVRDYVCTHGDHALLPEEESGSNSITLMRHGAFADRWSVLACQHYNTH